MACQRSFARCVRSWRALRPITSRRSSWCWCPSFCSWSIVTTASSSCRRSTASWRWSEWRQSSRCTRASRCKNRRSLWRTWTCRSPSRPTWRSWSSSSISSAIRCSVVTRLRWALARASSRKRPTIRFLPQCFSRSMASVATTTRSTNICRSASSNHRGSSTSCRGGWPRRNCCQATTRWRWTITKHWRCRCH